MPSSPGYVRNYKREEATAKARGEDKGNAERHVARRYEAKRGLVKPFDGKDVDHRNPLVKGGSNRPKNYRVETAHANRSYRRNRNGGMK